MKLKYSPFELDKEFMIQRNNKLLKHYDQLNITFIIIFIFNF